jgi:LPXTG-motif cell wall-anchored protein
MRARSRAGKIFAVASAIALLSLSTPTIAVAAEPSLTVTPLEWNVVGLDSNTPAQGPNRFMNGAQVCNTGDAVATEVAATWAWDSDNPAISMDGPASRSLPDLAPGECASAWFGIAVQPEPTSFDEARRFHITVTAAGAEAASTPAPREIYVERFVSQNRNSVTASDGPSQVTVGETYTFSFSGATATTYEQLAAQPYFDPDIFEVRSVRTVVQSGQSVSQFYTDACGWDSDPTSPDYLSCSGSGKAGGTLTVEVEVAVVGTGTATVSALIYDFSGSSFHYNSDFGDPTQAIEVVATEPAPAAPVAVDETVTTAEDTATVINVLGNDTDADGDLDPGTVTVTTGPAHGTVAVDPGTGAVTYTPAANYAGPDSFTYQVCDATGACDTATVQITVTAVNDAPIAINDVSLNNKAGTPVTVYVTGNDQGDLNPGSVRIINGEGNTVIESTVPGQGIWAVNTATGGITFTPDDGFTGNPEPITYQVTDTRGNTVNAEVTITFMPAEVGTVGAGTLTTDLADTAPANGGEPLANTGAQVGIAGILGLVLLGAGLVLTLRRRQQV